jgi:hypothetical protein
MINEMLLLSNDLETALADLLFSQIQIQLVMACLGASIFRLAQSPGHDQRRPAARLDTVTDRCNEE